MPNRTSVLVVEDDDAIRHGTMLRLDCMGYRVILAVDGVDGLAQARVHQPDLIMMDIRMPKMDGIDALRKLKADPSTNDIPVVIASASPGDQSNAIDSGAKFFLRKPYTNDALSTTLHCSVRKPSSSTPCSPKHETTSHPDD